MSNNRDYKNLKKLVNSLSNNLEALENGYLSAIDIYSLLDDARSIYERMAILHYLAIKKDVKKETKQEIKFNFSNQEIHPNQTNLIDAINVEHHIEAVRKSIGEQKPLFEIENEMKDKLPIISQDNKPTEPIIKESIEESVVEKKKEEEVISINDKFSSNATHLTIADKLGQQPIEDLTKFIGLNQKFLFMNDLFEGDNEKYKEAIEVINNYNSFMDAKKFIDQFNWNFEEISAQKFINLVKRRFL